MLAKRDRWTLGQFNTRRLYVREKHTACLSHQGAMELADKTYVIYSSLLWRHLFSACFFLSAAFLFSSSCIHPSLFVFFFHPSFIPYGIIYKRCLRFVFSGVFFLSRSKHLRNRAVSSAATNPPVIQIYNRFFISGLYVAYNALKRIGLVNLLP